MSFLHAASLPLSPYFHRLQAFVFYLLTGTVVFAPLRSQSTTVARSATRTPQHQAPSCSPKSMYRLAQLVSRLASISDPNKQHWTARNQRTAGAGNPRHRFKDIACQHCARIVLISHSQVHLSHHTLPPLTSGFRYPEIQQIEVNFLIDKGFTTGVFAAMPTWISKVASGSLGCLSSDVLALLLQRLANKPVPRPESPLCDYCGESCPHCGRGKSSPSKKARNVGRNSGRY